VRLLSWLAIGALIPLSGAGAEPLDLRDATPRAVAVSFEVSPTERPGALDAVYSEPVRAHLEPTAIPGQVRVRVPGRDMERLFTSYDPLPGSFSEYVWTFDAASGEVLGATLRGRLNRPVPLGVVTHVETRIEVRVNTRRAVGFRPPRVQLGQVIFDTCDARTNGCTVVQPKPLDPRTGYVNAVGTILAKALVGIAAESFAPVGEAIFSELPSGDLALSAVSAGPAD
jgi:hypothetical protein